MSPTLGELVADVDLPKDGPGWTAELKAKVAAADDNFKATVLTLARGEPGQQPDLLGRFRKEKVNENDNSAENTPQSESEAGYKSKVDKVNAIKDELRGQNAKVDMSSHATLSASNSTYKAVMEKINALEKVLAAAPGPSEGKIYISPATETALLDAVKGTVEAVYDEVAKATDDIEAEANRIRNSTPTYGAPAYPSFGGGRPTALPIPHSKGEYVAATPRDKVDVAIKKAWDELARGVSETNGNNHVDAPYNIDDAWCASFATWAWKDAGIDPHWNNKNYVPAIWADAGSGENGTHRGLISSAGAGDLLIWGDQGHIGLVVARNGNMITTIEGNSGDQVSEHTYDITKGGFAGVVHPPAGSRSPSVGSLP
ncbi:CHAP domain-containing protein [Nocardia sp. NBC_01009]|uniref:CHAP domain-containing protein n=1 Tax=Nocardia sp. NBC_01009 TaxID=2975996 RepID=UPI00386CABB1|nr:CHAP domain-containing protein [Nocardia sp. NBC_01009]